MSQSAVLFAFCLTTAGLLAAEGPDSPGTLAKIFSPEEYARAGLHKLTPAEITALESALQSHRQLPATPLVSAARESRQTKSVVPAAKVPKSQDQGTVAFGAEQVVTARPAELDAELRSRIEGSFDGFSGRAVFVLENGQIWQQRNPESVSFSRKLVNPEVVITRGAMGYRMLIVPADRMVFVKRVQ